MKKILIIDDSVFMRTILKDILQDKSDEIFIKESFEIYEADGKENALKQFEKINPDIILLDIVMKESETEGLEFLASIRDRYNTKHVIIISSIGQPSILEKCNELGISCYLQKPFEKKQVIQEVNRIFNRNDIAFMRD